MYIGYDFGFIIGPFLVQALPLLLASFGTLGSSFLISLGFSNVKWRNNTGTYFLGITGGREEGRWVGRDRTRRGGSWTVPEGRGGLSSMRSVLRIPRIGG